MTIRRSTGCLNSLATHFGADFANVFLDFYTGSQPASSDDAPTGTKLVTFSVNHAGTGGAWGTPAAGVIDKDPAEVWQGVGLANGAPGWWRLRLGSDTGVSSTTEKRVDGTVAASGADVNFAYVIETGKVYTCDAFPVDMDP